MNEQIRADFAAAPHLFNWRGSIPLERLRDWAARSALVVPEELLDLWAWTGGGDLFESETLLRPAVDGADDESVEESTGFLRSRGLPEGYLVFLEGGFLSTIRESDGSIVWLDSSTFSERGVFTSLSDWYTKLVRAEYAARYGLAP